MRKLYWSAAALACVAVAESSLAQSSFQRGDSNADGAYDITDPVHGLSYLFIGGSAPPCLDATDANDDERLDVSDAVHSLSFLFTGGPAPPAPFGSCGPDPTGGAEGLTCAAFPGCAGGPPSFPRPDPDPCSTLGEPCASAVIGPYVMVSMPEGDGAITTATHRSGEVMLLRWLPAEEDTTDLVISLPDGPSLDPIRMEIPVPALDDANLLAGVTLLLNTDEAAAMQGAGGNHRPPSQNHAGCDPAELMGWADCTPAGKCCDLHDACIWEECTEPGDSTDLRNCARQTFDYLSCLAGGESHDNCLRAFPQCGPRCSGCHALAAACIALSLRFPLFGAGRSACCARGDCGQLQKCILNGVVQTLESQCPHGDGSYWGDVHVVTFDRLAYDFQGVGEYVVTRAATEHFEVQSRTAPWRGSRHVSVTTAVAMNVDGDRVAVYLDRTPSLYVDGAPTAPAALPLALSGGGRMQLAGGGYLVEWADGSQVQVSLRGTYMSLYYRAAGTLRGLLVGLMGDFNGSQEGELVSRDGEVLGRRPTLEELYGVFGDSWRVAPEESLFDYFDGATTETHTDRSFPDGAISSASLTPEQRAAAEAACAAAGITDPVLLEACLIDVGSTGDASFAEETAAVSPPASSLPTPCGATSAAWVDWTGNTATTATGSVAGIDVTYTGELRPAPNLGTGGNFWASHATTYTKPGIVDNSPPTQDIIAMTGGPATGSQTLTFSTPVVDPVMALFSLGRPGVQARWEFDTPFEILNTGPGYYGNGPLVQLEGNVLAGSEGYGLIRFRGTVTSISWTNPIAESWSGFQVGFVGCR